MPFKDFFRKKKPDQLNNAEVAQAGRSHDGETDQWGDMQSDSLVLIMGVTGAGKSYFINQLKPNSVTVGHGLKSRGSIDTRYLSLIIYLTSTAETRACKLVQMQIGACTVAAVDTPGFDDDDDSDAVILGMQGYTTSPKFLLTKISKPKSLVF